MIRRFCAAILLMPAAVQAFATAHPVGIVLSVPSSAEIKRAKTDSWLEAQSGLMLFGGDALRAGDEPLSFALCPGLTVQRAEARQTVILPHPAANGSCDLPDTVSPESISTRGGPESPCQSAPVDLLAELHEAVQATKRGDSPAAAVAYGRISCAYPAAGWARGMIAYLPESANNPAAAGTNGETYALLIGISRYADKTPQGSLAYAAADAIAFSTFLQQPRGGGVPRKNILLLTDESATRAAIDNAIDTFVHDARKKENTLIVFIAGHGDYLTTRKDSDDIEIHEDPFFVTYDSYLQDVKTTGFPMSRIRDFIADQADGFRRVIAYVDICHAGYTAHVGEPSARDLPPAVRKVFLAKKGALGVLMATRPEPDAFAYESPTFGGGHGAFTYAVLSNLISGKPMPGHKELSLATLFSGTTGNVVFLTNGAQVPDEFSTNPQMSVLDDATVESSFTLDKATPLPEAATRRRRGAQKPEPPADASGAQAAAPASTRVGLQDRGQAILVRYMRGEQTAMVKQDFELCATYFGAALAIAPLSVFDESRALFCQGRAALFDATPQAYRQAIRLLGRSILLDPEHAYAYNALGIAYLEQVRNDVSNYDRAVAAFQDAIRFAPRWVYPLHNLALAYSERGDFLAARQTYLRAMELARYYSYLPYNLGLLNQNVNRLDDAEKYYRIAIETADEARRLKIEPATPRFRERAVAWNALATVEIARRRFDRALTDVKKALADDDALIAARHNEALLLSRTGPSAEAERLWRGIVASDAKAEDSRLALAQYLDRNGRHDEALVECEALLRLSADSVEGHRLAGSLLLRQNKPAEALPHLDAVRNRLRGDGTANEAWADAAALLKLPGAADGYRLALRTYTASGDKRRVAKKLAAIQPRESQ
jgi:tetratricopeptide (TPR) repeat protein